MGTRNKVIKDMNSIVECFDIHKKHGLGIRILQYYIMIPQKHNVYAEYYRPCFPTVRGGG